MNQPVLLADYKEYDDLINTLEIMKQSADVDVHIDEVIADSAKKFVQKLRKNSKICAPKIGRHSQSSVVFMWNYPNYTQLYATITENFGFLLLTNIDGIVSNPSPYILETQTDKLIDDINWTHASRAPTPIEETLA